MKSVQKMHELAERLAYRNGPRIVTVLGQDMAAYHLTKGELRTLFLNNGFNPDRVSWLKYIQMFTEWGELLTQPQEAIMDDKNDKWSLVFPRVGGSYEVALKMFSEDNGLKAVIA